MSIKAMMQAKSAASTTPATATPVAQAAAPAASPATILAGGGTVASSTQTVIPATAAPVTEIPVTPTAPTVTEQAPTEPAKPKRTRKASIPSVEAAPAAVAPAVTETAVAVVEQEETALSLPMTSPVGKIVGQIEASDLKLPRLINVQSVGDLSAVFQPGTITLDGEVVVAGPDPKQPMKASEALCIIPIRAAKVFRENFKYNDPTTKDKVPREFASEDEVVANGGVVDFNEGTGHFRPALNVLLAIAHDLGEPIPEDQQSYFVDVDEEAGLALAVCTMRFQKTAFNGAGKTLITDQARALRREEYGLLAGFYSYKLERIQLRTGDWVWLPSLTLLRERTPLSTRKMLAEIYG